MLTLYAGLGFAVFRIFFSTFEPSTTKLLFCYNSFACSRGGMYIVTRSIDSTCSAPTCLSNEHTDSCVQNLNTADSIMNHQSGDVSLIFHTM